MDRELYYYTTTDTLRFILEKGDIYATNIRYMNDSEEYFNGLKELHRLINNEGLVKKWLTQKNPNNLTYEDLKSTFTEDALQKNMDDADFYSISFCQKNDLLSQWAIYSRESGVSIKMYFDRNSYSFVTESIEKQSSGNIQEHSSVNNEKQNPGEPEAKARFQQGILPMEVYYFTHDVMKGSEYKDTAFEILDRLYAHSGVYLTEDIQERWRYTATYIKRYDFYQETECRLVFQPRASALPPKIQYRCDRKVLKPYLDIECEGGWPIWEIMIGPGFNQEVVFNSVKHFLENVAVKNGVMNVRDYIQRVEKYFQSIQQCVDKEDDSGKGAHKLDTHEIEALITYTKYRRIVDFYNSAGEGEEELSNARINLFGIVQEICTEIREKRECQPFSKMAEFLDNHYFAESGIVVSKSSIPYLF